ncbi:MAG: hypothetical protein L6R38_003028 [Xanthoria sp. 2 TBL-2021]|nr:MAG: hypothetical protein L6R38_003028 [Xanthoria sp. 2 TBL-2021]
MNHLPLPHESPYHHIQVPYLDNISHNKGSWYTYPQRHGWQVNQNKNKTVLLWNGEKRSTTENEAFVQSWLYFELLRVVLGDLLDVDQFTRKEAEGTIVISTENLETLLGKWSVDCGYEKKELDESYKLLIEHRTIGLVMSMTMDLGDSSIMLSIAALNERLMAAVMDLHVHLGLETPVDQAWRLRQKEFPDVGQPILDLMQTRGWCPYDLRRLDTEIEDVSILYYYSNLKAPRSSKDHSGCSKARCVTMLTNPATYKLSHRSGCYGCPLLSANLTHIERILRNDSIPLISLKKDTKITVHDLNNITEFVAISHVWAEGAGNVDGNALQTCLLEDVSELVKKLPGDKQDQTYFWIDTLCVPVRPPEMQTLALNKMRVPYERAKHVLVLDSHLRSLNSKNLSTTELFAQVSCSSWMRRLWTLQEGRLAENVWFQFANEAVNVKTVFTNLNRRRVPTRVDRWLGTSMALDLCFQIWYRVGKVPNTSLVAASLSLTSHSLRTRSVSVPTDEALCLVNIMDMDLTRVTTVAPTKRMEVFWRTFEKVPKSFLFSKASKMPVEGIHWAPSSFMGFLSEKEWLGPQDLSSPREDDPHAIVTSAGLQLALPAFIFHQDLVGRMKQFDFTWNFPLTVQDTDGIWYSMRVDEPWRQGSDNISGSQQLVVILAHELKSYESSEKFSFQDFAVGVLVSIDKTEDDIMHVTAHYHVAVELLGEGFQEYFSTANLCAQTVGLEQSILSSESHVASKERHTKAARQSLEDTNTMDMMIGQARHMSEPNDYEHLLSDLLDATVVAARFGDCSQVQKVAGNQQWCVD